MKFCRRSLHHARTGKMRTEPPFAHAANAHAAFARARGTGLSAMRRYSLDRTLGHVRTGRFQTDASLRRVRTGRTWTKRHFVAIAPIAAISVHKLIFDLGLRGSRARYRFLSMSIFNRLKGFDQCGLVRLEPNRDQSRSYLGSHLLIFKRKGIEEHRH